MNVQKCYWDPKNRTALETSKVGSENEMFGFKKYDKIMNLIQSLESSDGTESTYKYENGKLIYTEDRGEDGGSDRKYKYEIDSINGIVRTIQYVKSKSDIHIDKFFNKSWVIEENIGSVKMWKRLFHGKDTTLYENEYVSNLLTKRVRTENSKRTDSEIYNYIKE